MSILIDPEFKSLIPPLTPDEYTQLEKNIVKEGIRDPLVVWPQGDGNDILLDGHNRFNISIAHHGLHFDIRRMNFGSKDEARRWIILNQFGRRNLSAYDRSVLALKLKSMLSEKAKAKETERKTTYQKSEKSSLPTVNTTMELAKMAGVSHDTIHKVEAIESSDDEVLKEQVRSGEVSINQAYKVVRGVPEDKSPAQQKKEFLEQTQREHQEFKEKKTVDFAEIKTDKENRAILANDLYTRLLRMGSGVQSMFFEVSDGNTNLREVSRDFSEEQTEIIIIAINTWITQLSNILEVVKG